MQIIFDFQIFSLQQYGGVSRYFVELAHNLSILNLGIVPTVVAPYHVSSLLEEAGREGKVQVVGRKIPMFPGKHHFLPILNRFASQGVIKDIRQNIIHETYYTDRPIKYKGSRILTVFDMIHERFPEYLHGVDEEIPRLKAKAIARADHVLAISDSTRNDILELCDVPAEKVSVVHLASSIENPPQKKIAGLNRPIILYVGLRSGVKNFSTLLLAYSKSELLCSNFDLICVGGGSFTPDEQKNINDAGLRKKVLHLQADDNMLPTLYANASLFVYPSLYEGFGIPILEAMRCGCPVACSNTSSMPEIAGDAAVYFDPRNQDEIQAVMESVIHSDDLAEELRAKGYEQGRKFSWQQCASITADIYRRHV